MNIYPYTSPIILDDATFIQYGGQTGTTLPVQRTAAYLIAEKRVTNYLGTFLAPTVVTGTFPYKANNFIVTDYGYVNSIDSAILKSIDNLQTCSFHRDAGCAFIFEDTFGYLNFSCVNNICGCAGWALHPYQYEIVYNAGLPTGTSTQADILLALTIIAQETLGEMVYPYSNEAPGAIGITAWSSLEYSETRMKQKRTALGESARASFAARLLDNAVKRAVPYIGI